MKNFITIQDVPQGIIEQILTLAGRVKDNPALIENSLRGKTIGLVFEKPSTRTWVSFEVGIAQMKGTAVYLGPQDIHLNKREDTKDVARVLSRYLDGIVLRTFKHETVEEFAEYFSKPVINGLTDKAHPCQAMADFLTLKETFKKLRGLTLCFVGDGNNVLHSLLLLGAKMGVNIHYACPTKYQPQKEVVEAAKKTAGSQGAKILGFTDPKEAVAGAQAVYTDVWVSMGEEKIAAQKKKSFKPYQINAELMKLADKRAIILHCLPAHKGEEITEEVMESHASRIFDQAENRLHVQKAILTHLFKKL